MTINIVHGDYKFRDATRGRRIPVRNGVRIEPLTFITIENNEIIPATANSQNIGVAMTGVTGDEKKGCSVVYLQLTDGFEFDIVEQTKGQNVNVGFYTLANNKSIDLGSHSETPIANAFNFFYNGRAFVTHSFGF